MAIEKLTGPPDGDDYDPDASNYGDDNYEEDEFEPDKCKVCGEYLPCRCDEDDKE